MALYIQSDTSFIFLIFGTIGTATEGLGLVTVDISSAMTASVVLVLPDLPLTVEPYLGTFISSSQYFVPMSESSFYLYESSNSISLPQ